MASDDSTGSGKGGRKVIPWPEIRKAYEAGESIASLSRRFSVRRHTIAARAQKECWTVQPTVHMDAKTAKAVQAKAQSNVIDIATKKVVEEFQASGDPEKMAATIAERLKAVAKLDLLALQLLERGFERALKLGVKDPETNKLVEGALILGDHQGETTAINDLLNAKSRLLRDLRLDGGLKDGTPSAESVDPEEQKVDQLVLVVRERKESA